jgi:hypothetical protein
MPIYVIYDLEKVWPKAYTNFGEALSLVIKQINIVNDAYFNSEAYNTEPLLPGKIEEYEMAKVKEGILVANIHDYDEQIFIQELEI